MAESNADRDLLFGILALQMGFITRDALISAMGTCANEKDKSVGQALKSQGALAEEDDQLLDSLVRRLMEKHDNNARKSLAAVTTVSAIQDDRAKIRNHDLRSTIDYAPNAAEETEKAPDATMPETADATRVGGTRFRLLNFHARGGLGEVWVARDVELNREVALKRIQEKHADSPQSRTRFLHEAEVTGRLEHRGIVPVYGLGHFENGRPYYAMRFVSGTSLKDAIAKFHGAKDTDHAGVDRSLDLRRLLGTFVDVCNTVAYAHSRGVLHRDLKPDNIILDEYGETLVVDWGLAKTGAIDVDSALNVGASPPVSTSSTPYTLAGTTLGTPGFMSPEQAMGRLSDLSPASDVYSLGATLYCLLTGKTPFNEPDPILILPKVCAGDFPRPREVKSKVPVALEAICLKAMAVSPDDRYSSAGTLGEEIERWLADQPVLAYPEPLSARALRWVRRRKQWVAAAAVFLILAVLGLAIYDWRITAEKARSTDQLAMTRAALRELLKVSGENLTVIPNTEKLREHLAQLVLDRYHQLGDRFPGDPGVRFETAQVLHVIGAIGGLTGQFAKSQASYEKAIRELTNLCENSPGRIDYRRWLVEVFIDRGELNHMNGRTIDAENDFQAAITNADKLRSVPLSPNYRRTMGPALINLSEILVLKCQYAEAHTAADRAVELLRPTASPDAGSAFTTRDRWLLSMALTDRGVASREAGNRDRAAHDFDQAAQVAGSVAQDDEVYDDSRFQLACIANQRGELLSTDLAKLPESEKNFEQASQTLTRLINNHKVIPHYREEMAVTLCGRAAVRFAMTRIPDAERDCEAALEHLTGLITERTRKGAPENPQYLSLLGQVLNLQSRIHFLRGRLPEGRRTHAEAVEKLSRAIELDPARAADKVRLEQIQAGPAQ
jgi:eukaryotic-like serine/threonine-protein kinase